MKIFDYENEFFQNLSKISDLIILNLIFIISCIPIVTIGASLTSAYYVSMKLVRGDNDGIIKTYIEKFKREFKMSTIIWSIILLLALVIGIDFYVIDNISNLAMVNLFSLLLTIGGIILLFIFVYVFPFISKFENSIKNTVINSFLISIQNLPYTLIMSLVTTIPILSILLLSNYWGQIIFLNTVITFSIVFYINSSILNKIFNKYIEKKPINE